MTQSHFSESIAEIEEGMPPRKTADCEAVIVGAGPYGLSAAAHLKSIGLDVRIFGKPMDFWANQMPAGMLLRSPRPASNISDPDRQFTLEDYEHSTGISPRAPLPLETFVDYGKWFQRRLSPELDSRNVQSVQRTESGFCAMLEDGEQIHCKRVIVAAGIGPFQRVPSVFSSLPPAVLSHCYQGRAVRSYAGMRVAVIGAGQSALESAALLKEAGAQVEVIARLSELRWIGMHVWLHRLGPISSMLYSPYDVGPAGISRLVAQPNLTRCVPLNLRDKIRRRAVRPAGSPWLRPRLMGVKLTTGRYVRQADLKGQVVELTLDDGSRRSVDCVLLGTGYDVDIARYAFLSPALVQQIDCLDGYPRLESGFRCSVPGLHFIGAPAARTFGPLLYFVAGTEFTSRALASHISRNRPVSR